MCKLKEIIFEVHIDHAKVRDAIKDLENTPETKAVRDANMTFYKALLACNTVSVPETHLHRVIPFLKEIA